MIFIKQVIFVKSVNYLVNRRGPEEAPLFRIPHSQFRILFGFPFRIQFSPAMVWVPALRFGEDPSHQMY